jgi:hypothetical protein
LPPIRSWGQAIGLHVAQYRDREQSRRPYWPIGLLELAGEARRRDDIAGAPDAEAAALAMRDQRRLAQRWTLPKQRAQEQWRSPV